MWENFERLLYKNMFSFLIENHLISQNQSKFKPGDSCINQLLSISHDVYKFSGDGLKVRGAFLDISKVFDKVLQKGVILKIKLKQNGLSGNLQEIIEDFLSNKYQIIILNGQASEWDA